MKKNNLIVSPWKLKFDNKSRIIFLADYSKPENFEDLSQYKILKYHWNDKSKQAKDYIYLSELKRKILPLLAKELNFIHGTNYSIRSWNLIIGYWLTSFLVVTFDRLSMLNLAQDKYKNLITYFIEHRRNEFIPKDTLDAILKFQDEKWNYIFINNLIEYFELISIKKERNNFINIKNKKKTFLYKVKNLNFLIKKIIKNLIFRLVNFISKKLNSSNKLIILSESGLSIKQFLKLKKFLKGKTIFEPNISLRKPIVFDESMRSWKIELAQSDNQFEIIIKELIPKWMPLIFLEGFKNIKIPSSLSNLEKPPEVIFTSYAQFFNDPFKVWAAGSIDNGSKLIIGSHLGGVLVNYHMNIDYEAEICDHYLVSGEQKQKYNNSIKVPQVWNTLKNKEHNNNGDILIVTTTNPKFTRDLATYPLGEQMYSYFNHQFKFYSKLTSKVKEKTRVRLYKFDNGWPQKKYWIQNFPKIKFTNDKLNYPKLVSNSGLIVCTYLGRAFIELLSANIPTIIFWDPNFWGMADFCNKDFDELKKIGIFYNNPIKAADKVNKISDNIDSWWYSDEVQKVRYDFCMKYGQLNPMIINDLGKILNSLVNK